MDETAPKSRFVRLIMAGASEEEIEEATRYWLAYLRLLDVAGNDVGVSDSRTNDPYVRFDDDNPPDV